MAGRYHGRLFGISEAAGLRFEGQEVELCRNRANKVASTARAGSTGQSPANITQSPERD